MSHESWNGEQRVGSELPAGRRRDDISALSSSSYERSGSEGRMSKSLDTTGLQRGAYPYITAHLDAIENIKPPDQTFEAGDIHEAAKQHLQKLRWLGAVEVVQRTEGGTNIYRTREATWEIIEDCSATDGQLLCGHDGFRNVGGGLYECARETCTHRYTKDTLEMILGRSE